MAKWSYCATQQSHIVKINTMPTIHKSHMDITFNHGYDGRGARSASRAS